MHILSISIWDNIKPKSSCQKFTHQVPSAQSAAAAIFETVDTLSIAGQIYQLSSVFKASEETMW